MAGTGSGCTVLEEVQQALRHDPRACDFILGLFWSALSSYRHDTVLRPYPPEYVLADGSKDVDGLKSVFTCLQRVSVMMSGNNSSVIPEKSLSLLHWILSCSSSSFTLSSRPVDTIAEINSHASKLARSVGTPTPHTIIEVVYSEERERQFQCSAGEYGTFLAYHGSRIDNFYSIIHNGLLNHMNKMAVFGQGTYLSTDISVCMNFSPTGTTWEKDQLPSLCSMVAVCEVINHPDIRSRTQVDGEPSINRNIPREYFVVKNDSLLRVKYVLVFSHRNQCRAPQGWLSRHKWLVGMAVYLLLLVLVGLYHGGYYTKLYNKLYPRHMLN